jgi:hypothetical protein
MGVATAIKLEKSTIGNDKLRSKQDCGIDQLYEVFDVVKSKQTYSGS